jgi:catechol 2,3-dioxygenase-like lactoylglutathione lyase family enzyme
LLFAFAVARPRSSPNATPSDVAPIAKPLIAVSAVTNIPQTHPTLCYFQIEAPNAMKLARVILFTAKMEAMSKFYGTVLGLKQVSSEKGWREFAAGPTRIALHSGPSSPGRKGPKIVFYAKDVAAAREKLTARGANFGKVHQGEKLRLCDGKDPDGNPIQLSDR